MTPFDLDPGFAIIYWVGCVAIGYVLAGLLSKSMRK